MARDWFGVPDELYRPQPDDPVDSGDAFVHDIDRSPFGEHATGSGSDGMGVGDFFRELDRANVEETREAMHQSYERHLRELRAGRMPLPKDTSEHEGALYGALATRYMSAMATRGVTVEEAEEKVSRMEPFLWLELLPLMYLDGRLGVEALAEYVVWKESSELPGTDVEAKLPWLKKMVRYGVKMAEAAGRSDDVAQARYIRSSDGQEGESPWVQLL